MLAHRTPTIPSASADIDIVACPACDRPAEVIAHATVPSTDAPIDLVRVACVYRHRFLMPRAGLHPLRFGGTDR